MTMAFLENALGGLQEKYTNGDIVKPNLKDFFLNLFLIFCGITFGSKVKGNLESLLTKLHGMHSHKFKLLLKKITNEKNLA